MSIKHTDPVSGPVRRTQWDAAHVIEAGSVPLEALDASGTPDVTTYLRGDATWAPVAGGGGTLWRLTGPAPVVGSDWLVGQLADGTPVSAHLSELATVITLGGSGAPYAVSGHYAVGLDGGPVAWDLLDPTNQVALSLGAYGASPYSPALDGTTAVGGLASGGDFVAVVWDLLHPAHAPVVLPSLDTSRVAVGISGRWVIGGSTSVSPDSGVAWNLDDPTNPILLGTVDGYAIPNAIDGDWIVGTARTGGYYVPVAWNVADLATAIPLVPVADTNVNYIAISGTTAVAQVIDVNSGALSARAWTVTSPATAPVLMSGVDFQNYSGAYGAGGGYAAGEVAGDAFDKAALWTLADITAEPTTAWDGWAWDVAYSVADPADPQDGDMAIGTDGSIWLYADPDWMNVKAGGA